MAGLTLIGSDCLAIANPDPTVAPVFAQTPASPLSQSPSTASPLKQGFQVSLNGRALPIPWAQWPTNPPSFRISLSDAGTQRSLGVQFLNTENPAQQPIQWFSDATNPLSLPVRLSGPLRYLDITDLAKRFGWQLTLQETTLQITTPGAKVLGIRQAKQPWGDRLVIELDRPTPWQTDLQNQELVLTLDAQIAPPVIQQIKAIAGTYLQSVKVEPITNRTRLRLGGNFPNQRPRVWSLAAPNRLVVDVRPDSLVEQNIVWAPGLRWRQQILNVNSIQVPVVWLEVNPRQPGLRIRPILPNPTTMMGTAPLLQTAQQAQVSAAMNGGFFNRIRQLPLGAIRLNNRWLSGPILNRGAIAWDATGNMILGRLTLRETLITPTNQRFPLTHLNSGYVQAGIARYTTDWGPTYTTLADNEILVTVQNNQVTGQQTLEKAGTNSPIPSNGYLLVLRSNRAAAPSLAPGTTLRLESPTEPADFSRYPQIIAAGPLLLQNRQVVLNAKGEGFSDAFVSETAARSAIAKTANGTVLIVAAHSRLDGTGLTLPETAQLLQQLGAIDALNLDGGSSTTLYLGGQLLDRPSQTAARVHNGIGIFVPTSPPLTSPKISKP